MGTQPSRSVLFRAKENPGARAPVKGRFLRLSLHVWPCLQIGNNKGKSAIRGHFYFHGRNSQNLFMLSFHLNS